MTQTPRRQYFYLIDPLRGFAAISVLVYHVIEITEWKDFPTGYGLAWFRWGWMGTDIFFVISGFAITLSALNILEKNNHNHKKTICEFASKRIRRIAPLHYLTLTIFIIFANWSLLNIDNWYNIIAHLLFVHNLFPEFHRSINAPNWTLGMEAQFYLLLIIIIPYVNYKNLKYFIAGAFSIAFIWRTAVFFLVPKNLPSTVDTTFMLATQLPGMLDFFACGMFIAFFTKSKYFQLYKNSFITQFCIFIVIIIWGCLSFLTYSSVRAIYWTTSYTVIFPRSMLAILFSLLVILLCALNISQNVKKIFAPFIYLGTISYGIYLFHWPVLRFIYKKDIDHIWKLIFTVCMSIALASLSWHFYEKRFLKRAKNR